MVRRFKHTLMTLLKLGLAGSLIAWLIYSGKLDFSQLAVLCDSPSIMVITVLYWFFCLAVLGAQRWRLLLKAVDYPISLFRAINLQLTGFFFNSTMPGAVSGDLIKVFYVINDHPGKGKSKAFLTILLDRLIGLAGIFSIGLFVVLTHFKEVVQNPVLISLVSMLLSFVFFLALFFGAALYHYKGNDPFLRILQLPFPGISFLRSMYEALREFRYHRKSIFYGLLISIFNQLVALGLFCFIAQKMLPSSDINYTAIATVFPLGILVTALPIAPGGIGVGHVAFENLFKMVGLEQGANIFNIWMLTQLALNLFGILPYLYLKKKPSRKELKTQ